MSRSIVKALEREGKNEALLGNGSGAVIAAGAAVVNIDFFILFLLLIGLKLRVDQNIC